MLNRRILSIGLIFSMIATLLGVGCGKYRAAADPALTVSPSETAAQQAQTNEVKSAFDTLFQFYQLYGTKAGGFTKEGLMNLLEKFKPIIEKRGSGTTEEIKSLLEVLFRDLDKKDGGSGLKGIQDAVAGIEKLVPVLRWIKTGKGIHPSELRDTINTEFPRANPMTTKELAEQLFRNDEKSFGGNENGFLEREEVSTTGVIFSVLLSLDTDQIENALNKTSDIRVQILLSTLYRKLDKQIVSRFPGKTYRELSPEDRKLELMIMAIRYLQVDRAMQKEIEAATQLNPEKKRTPGEIEAKTAKDVFNLLKVFGIQEVVYFPRTVRFYLKMGLSPTDAATSASTLPNLTTLKLFNMVTDIQYVRDLREAERNQPVAAPKRFKQIEEMDLKTSGGNGNNVLDTSELALGLAFLDLEELLFQQFDRNKDLKLSYVEMQAMLEFLNFTDSLAMDAFMADAGLDRNFPGVFNMLQIYFYTSKESRKTEDSLTREAFHSRLWKVIDRRYH